ncbi:MAG TPA: carboxypeptidase-like regulatory domain-containing protein [Gemmatimonadaceae bacterium]|nr:carboxypeptidase-like regulatory domain-containing protein [Gemmatimonadaceae bacterium]
MQPDQAWHVRAVTTLTVALAFAGAASQGSAQQTPGPGARYATVAGIAVDSIRGGYLREALISVGGTRRTAMTDSVGRFRIDSIEPGKRALRMSHPLLDTLALSVATREIEFKPGDALSMVVPIPSAATIVAKKCPAGERSLGASALIGVVLDADTEVPSEGAEVIVSWTDYQVVNGDVSSTAQRRIAQVAPDGSYLICGIPSDLVSGVFATLGGDTTATVTLAFDRLLAMQSLLLPTDKRIRGAAKGDTSARRGIAALSGRVFDPNGRPVEGARVAVEDDEAITLTDAQGAYMLSGLRSGTRPITIRKIGFEAIEAAVNVTAKAPQKADYRLRNITRVLETVQINAIRDYGLNKVGFLKRQKSRIGRLYSPKEIAERNPRQLSSLLENAPMLRAATGPGGQRYITGRMNGCVRYFVDGFLTPEYGPQNAMMLPDSYLSGAEIAAVEVYDKLSAPGEFFAMSHSGQTCSSVVVWTKKKLGLR